MFSDELVNQRRHNLVGGQRKSSEILAKIFYFRLYLGNKSISCENHPESCFVDPENVIAVKDVGEGNPIKHLFDPPRIFIIQSGR